MRILLVYPNCRQEIIGWGDLGAIAEPLALEYIGTGAKLDGHSVKILDLRLHPEQLEPYLFAYQPDIVGVTGYSMHVIRNLDICNRVKSILPNCKTIVGGHHATLLPEDFFEPQMDYVVVGEGVAPFREVLAKLSADEPVQGIMGVWSRVDGEFKYGGQQPPLEINDIPVPDRTLTADDRGSYFIDWMHPIALVRTTVGCPYRCSFCSLWRIMDGRYHKRDVMWVVDELRTVPEDYVFLVDDEPFVNPPRMKELARCIKEAGIQKEYFAYCRIDSLLRDRDLMELWRDVGLRRVFFGVESIFEYELTDYNKKQKREQIIKGLQTARDLGISVFSNFIISPDYTLGHFEEIVQFIKDYDVEYPSFTILTPIPGTPAGSTFDRILERQVNGRPNWEYFDLQHAVTQTALPKDDFMQAYRNLQRVFASLYLNAQHPFYMTLQQQSHLGTAPSPGAN